MIATIFVVIGHSAYLSIGTTYGGVAYELPNTVSAAYDSAFLTWCRSLWGWVYGFHMPLFFMLSGAVLAIKPIACFDKIFKSKIKRLLIPYFFYGWLFMLPVKGIGNFYTKESFLLALRGFLTGEDSGHLWFLPALFWCILVFCVIQKVCFRFSIHSTYILVLVCGIINFTYSYIPFDIFLFKMGLSYIFWFSLGYAFEKERQILEPWNGRKVILAYIVTLVLTLLNNRYGVLNKFFVIVCGSFQTYLFANICVRIFKNIGEKKIWKTLINNLFFVYIFHDPLEYIVLRLFFSNNLLDTAFGCYLYTFTRTVVIFIVSVLLGEIITLMKKKCSHILNADYTKRI